MTMVRVILPGHLRTLAGIEGEVLVEIDGEATIAHVLDRLEARHPVLRGTIRDQQTLARRPFLRFFACGEDLSHEPASAVLPPGVAGGGEALRVVAAIAGG